MARRLIVLTIALLLGAQAVRNAAVNALAARNPDAAARVWPGHPAAEIALGMTEIGRAAGRREFVPATALADMEDAARKAPLAPEPFLVRGVRAQVDGEPRGAIEAFAAAVARDPRSLPGHYFLADALFRSGDARRGLRETAILARLAPGGIASIAPHVAAYAKDRRAWPELRDLFKSEPALEDAVLTALAADASNADMILALADDRATTGRWVPTLLNSLVAARQYAKARDIWARAAKVSSAADELYDGDFAETKAQPPFNWVLSSSAVGLAERGARGGLHVIFYGREDGLLARQLLLLPPGAYRMSMTVAGGSQGAHPLTWSVRCDGAQAPVAAIPLDVAGARPWSFAVPAGCPAQWLELSGVSADVERQSEVTIRNLKLMRERPNG
jgi:hypothetical protein